MIQRAKKKTSFLLGILVTGILGTIGGYINSNYSKEGSFLVPVAKADVPNPLSGIGFDSSSSALYSVDAGSGGGSGCDGGSGGSGDGGGSGGDCG